MSTLHPAPPAPVGGSLFGATTLICGVLMTVMAAIIVVRMFFGLASVTNLNDGYSWGLWVVGENSKGWLRHSSGFMI